MKCKGRKTHVDYGDNELQYWKESYSTGKKDNEIMYNEVFACIPVVPCMHVYCKDPCVDPGAAIRGRNVSSVSRISS